MNIKDFIAGSYKKGYDYEYFLPEKINHPFYWSELKINSLLETASMKIGELNAFSRLVPDTDWFIRMHIVKEAVVSSRIEGTQTNIEEALEDEGNILPERKDDWQEVNNYILAMNQAIEQLAELPLSMRLIRNTHRTLLSSGRGVHRNPGEIRQSQNWIGGASLSDAVFIPPAHTELADLLSDLEIFLNNSELQIPYLIRIAIAHYQFETIHPFLDGNGRIGRLLITLFLVSHKILDKPLLYLSGFFEKQKILYYDNLTFVRTKNNLAQWLLFFLTGVIQTADESLGTLKRIVGLKDKTTQICLAGMGKRSQTALKLLEYLFSVPIVTIKDVQNHTGISTKAANDLVMTFMKASILTELTGFRRNRTFIFADYLKLFKS